MIVPVGGELRARGLRVSGPGVELSFGLIECCRTPEERSEARTSDVHAKLEALSALAESGDELWVLGDLVKYGPNPREVVRGSPIPC